MKVTRTIVLLSLLCVAFLGTAVAQNVVNFKQLQGFLPTADLAGYTKGKPGGETTSAMGMSSSQASLKYQKADGPSIEVTIQDTAGVPMAMMGLSMMGITEYENETENGYDKTIKVQGFPGTEKVDRGDPKSAEITVVVGKRFMVELKCYDGDDVASLKKLVEGMDLAGLAKLAK